MTNHTQSIEVRGISLRLIPDGDADTSYLEQPEFATRLAAYERGEFSFVGIDAAAEVAINGVTQTITSGGLWGIETDSGEGYFAEVAEEEFEQLSGILAAMGAEVERPSSFTPQEQV